MIYRAITDLILQNLTSFPVGNIVGPRQVGKTTLAKYLRTRLGKPSIYLDLQNTQDLDKLSNALLFLKEHVDKCVIVDEIQRLPQLYGQLRSLIDADRYPGRFILLGSASPAIIKGVSESLAGRVFFAELMPFSLLEVTDEVTWKKHFMRGGFPSPLLVEDDMLVQEWFSGFLTTFVERDLPELGYNFTSMLCTRLLRMVAHTHGQTLNASKLAKSLDVSLQTVNRYLDILESGFMIRRLLPWHSNTGKRVIKSPKIYIRDSGILHHLLLLTNFDSVLGHPALGPSWEGYVIEQIIRVTQNKWQYYFYRTQHGAEADLVLINPRGEMFAIEIKFSLSPKLSNGFYQTHEDLNPKYKYVIIPEGESYPKPGGVRVSNLTDFLNLLKEYQRV